MNTGLHRAASGAALMLFLAGLLAWAWWYGLIVTWLLNMLGVAA